MLREDTLRTIKTAIARGEAIAPTPDQVRALNLEARKLRAEAMRGVFRNAFSWLFRPRAITLPGGWIDAVRGH
jgi:hypothetical protein